MDISAAQFRDSCSISIIVYPLLTVVRCVDISTHGPVSASASRVSLIVSNQPALRLSTDFLSPVQLTVDEQDMSLPMRLNSPMHFGPDLEGLGTQGKRDSGR